MAVIVACGTESEARLETMTMPVVTRPDAATRRVSPTTERTPVPEPTVVVTPTPEPTPTSARPVAGVLQARPTSQPQTTEVTPGVQPIGLATERDTLLYIPTQYTPDQPAALALLLHGAGGVAEYGLSILQGLADEHNLLLLAPASRRQTWDMIVDEYGPDVTLIDQALDYVFTRYNVDAARVAIGGFSDGASYALSLGITNGDLFTYIMAFSPGYMAPAREVGKPRIFISHGTRDDVLPIDACSRKIVPRLENANYNVRYREFDGPHTVPPEMTTEAVAWFKE